MQKEIEKMPFNKGNAKIFCICNALRYVIKLFFIYLISVTLFILIFIDTRVANFLMLKISF